MKIILAQRLNNSSKSAFSLNTFCSERLKEMAEKIGEPMCLDSNNGVQNHITIIQNKSNTIDNISRSSSLNKIKPLNLEQHRWPSQTTMEMLSTEDELQQNQNISNSNSFNTNSNLPTFTPSLQQHQLNKNFQV